MRPPEKCDVTVQFKNLTDCQDGGCHAYVWLPPHQDIGPSINVAICYHGGGWTLGHGMDVPVPEVDYLLEKQVIVVSIAYRLAPHATMQDILDDAKDGYDWVHNSLPELVGAKRIGQTVLLGWSAGAQIACMVAQAALHDHTLPTLAALMLTYGGLDIEALLGPLRQPTEQSHRLLEELKSKSATAGVPLAIFRSDPNALRISWYREARPDGTLLAGLTPGDSIAKHNPISFVDSSFPPCCILVATDDTNVPPEISYRFNDKLSKLGVETLLLKAEGMQHGGAENCPDPEAYARWFSSCTSVGLSWVVRRMEKKTAESRA